MSKVKKLIISDAVVKRFWNFVQKTETCWNWIGAINPSGHGVLKVDGGNRGAHRISYAIHYGELPIGAYICHKCDNAKCVHPKHIYAGTPQSNATDMVERNRTRHFVADNPTKYYGVRYDKSRSNWISYVYIDKKKIDIGRHVSEIDAARNHDRIIYMRYGKSDRLNFPDEYILK